MRIVLATPLYPPDIAEPAPYVKELATRLATLHTVTVVAYTRFPEKIPGVTILAVDKRQALPLRLLAYFWTLYRVSGYTDIFYAQNGASVEVPLLILSFIKKIRLYFCIGDRHAHTRTLSHPLLRSIERATSSRAKRVVETLPPARPEIIPLESYPTEAMNAYQQAWTEHLHTLETLFAYGT